MIDLRPLGYVIGRSVAILGATMLLPMVFDLLLGNPDWAVFLKSAAATIAAGALTALACANGAKEKLTLQQVFLLTTGLWAMLPFFGALPFWGGAAELSYTDAFFEAMSGLTTTGATVLVGLDTMNEGDLLWRGMLQWLGGVGIIVVAMVFLPELGVGGMQLFKSEGFETEGKILPRANQIASQISVIYLTLTLACGLTYAALGMDAFDALVHAMTTVATGGFANYDASFGAFGAPLQYACVGFMILAALPFVRYIQFVAGDPQPLWRDRQVRGFMATTVALVAVLSLWQWNRLGLGETPFREALFNTVAILTGTGYASADYMLWGPFAVAFFFVIGLIGGCAGSTACSIKIFRYQLLLASLRTQVRRIHSPNALLTPRYDGKPVSDEVLSSVMVFFVTFILSMGFLSVALGMTGLDMITAVSGAASALANIGPGLGPEIGPAGNYAGLPDAAKWLLAAAMLAGRLELLAVLAIFTPQFWRA